MPDFQLVTGHINIAGNRSSVTVRGTDNPMTYPEAIVLAALHGGDEHVHSLVSVGTVERATDEEYDRLVGRYGGRLVNDCFPKVGGRPSLPTEDEALPTSEEVAEVARAAEEARKNVKAKRTSKSKAKATPKAADEDKGDSVPDLADLKK